MKDFWVWIIVFSIMTSSFPNLADNVIINQTENETNVTVDGGETNTGINLGKGSKTIKGNGKIKTISRQVQKFNLIAIDGSYQVEISCGKSVNLKLTAEENLLPLITTKVSEGKLTVNSNKAFTATKTLKLKITVQELNFLGYSGTEQVKVNNLNTQDFSLNATGAGEFVFSGKADTFKVALQGAGELNAKDLTARKVILNMLGAANAKVTASEELNATVIGAGELVYYGNPAKITKKVTGGEIIPGK